MANEQCSIFDFADDEYIYKINKPIRLIEFFAGVGAQHKALTNLKANFESYKICEWALPSIIGYNAIHLGNFNGIWDNETDKNKIAQFLYEKGVSLNYNEPATLEQLKRVDMEKLKQCANSIINLHNLVDISRVKGNTLEIVDRDKYIYLLTYSYPCQDISSAGKQAGQVEGSGTRSSLLWEVGRILKECKESNSLPQVLLMENVPNCHGTKNIKEWHKWLETLEQLGYKNFWKDLNSKDYGIPQTRNRCYMVSILKESDKPIVYNFPKKKRLNLLLKDLLESNVDEKYYLSDKMIHCFSKPNQKENGFHRGKRWTQSLEKTNNTGVANTITTSTGNRVTDNFIITDTINKNLKTELCNELIATGKVKEYDVIRHSYSNSRLQEWDKRNTEQNNISPTLDTRCDCLGVVVNTSNKRLKETLSQSDIQDGCFIDAYNKRVNKDIAGTITTRVSESNCTFIACNDGVVIPENTKKGYTIANEGDGVYINRPEQKRGTVQKGMIPTLTTCVVSDVGVVVEEPTYLGTYQYSKSDKFMQNKERYKPNKECADTIQTTQKEGIVETSPRLLGGFGNKCNNDTQYHTQNRIYDDTIAVTVNTAFNPYYYSNLRIRKLTPLECFRLMAFSDEDYYKMKQYLSDSKLYHCMGDSIVVKVLEDIFRELIEPSNHNITIPLW